MAEEDIAAYINFAEKNYKKIFLAGHSLGANKVIYFLSKNPDAKIEKFLLLSPANLTYMMSDVTENEKNYQKNMSIMVKAKKFCHLRLWTG